jgi:hypothetical protein
VTTTTVVTSSVPAFKADTDEVTTTVGSKKGVYNCGTRGSVLRIVVCALRCSRDAKAQTLAPCVNPPSGSERGARLNEALQYCVMYTRFTPRSTTSELYSRGTLVAMPGKPDRGWSSTALLFPYPITIHLSFRKARVRGRKYDPSRVSFSKRQACRWSQCLEIQNVCQCAYCIVLLSGTSCQIIIRSGHFRFDEQRTV